MGFLYTKIKPLLSYVFKKPLINSFFRPFLTVKGLGWSPKKISAKSLIKILKTALNQSFLKFFFGFLFFTSNLHAETYLSVSSYLDQVVKANDHYLALDEDRSAYMNLSLKGDLLFTPELVSSVSYSTSEAPQFVPYFPIFFEDATLINNDYQIGLKQRTPIGLEFEAKTQLNRFDFESASPIEEIFLDLFTDASSKIWRINQIISARQHFWKDGFGKKHRSLAKEAESGALAEAHKSSFELDREIVKAKNIYWQLRLSRDAKNLRKETFQSAVKLLEHTQKKVKESLATESELFAAKSVYNNSKLAYEKSKDQEVVTAVAFNKMRGTSSSVVTEALTPLSLPVIEKMIPKERGVRGDLLAQKEYMRMQEAKNEVEVQDLLPTLDLSGFVTFSGTDEGFSDSVHESWSKPAISGGVQLEFNVPLSFDIFKVIRGHRYKSNAARLKFNRMEFQHDQEHDELMTRLNNKKEELELLIDNIRLQKEKYQNAKKNYDLGMASFFDMMTAENDYQTSRLAKVQTQEIMVELLLNLSLYKTDQT